RPWGLCAPLGGGEGGRAPGACLLERAERADQGLAVAADTDLVTGASVPVDARGDAWLAWLRFHRSPLRSVWYAVARLTSATAAMSVMATPASRPAVSRSASSRRSASSFASARFRRLAFTRNRRKISLPSVSTILTRKCIALCQPT